MSYNYDEDFEDGLHYPSVSDTQVIHCEDQVRDWMELEPEKLYVKVDRDQEKEKATIIRVKKVKVSANGQVLVFDRLTEDLSIYLKSCSGYLTDLGVLGYQYRGKISWNRTNYIRHIRSTDYNHDLRLRKASRLLMVPTHVQKISKKIEKELDS